MEISLLLVFHSIEGGALIINELVQKARYLINFGIKNQEEIPHLGTKMNEFEAAMGLDDKTKKKSYIRDLSK